LRLWAPFPWEPDVARVECEVEEVDVPKENGRTIPGVRVTCGECGHSTESFGTGDGSIKRCLILLREECPRNEKNYYVTE